MIINLKSIYYLVCAAQQIYIQQLYQVMAQETHVLKFVNKGKTFPTNVGVTCFPRQTYGVSQESPSQFQQQTTLIGQNGYNYRYDEEDKPTNFSQKKYCSVVGNTIDVVQNFPIQYEESITKNPNIFRRRKGRLTEFMDKNGWMNKVCKIMGFERTDKARQAQKKDREKKIKSLSIRKYDNPVALKPLPKQNLPALYIEKARIRGKRFSLRNQKEQDLKIQRSLQETEDKFVVAQAMTNKLASTLNDKEWKSTMTSVRNKYNKSQISNRMDYTVSNWNKTIELRQVEEKDGLKDWFNSTCNTNSNRWKFRKPKKVDTDSEQQIMDD